MLSEGASRVLVYTDGSCLGNPGPGGWAVHIELPDGEVFELGGAELHTTNNRMELRAAIEAVRATAGWPAVTILTDSQYVRRGITEWLAGWKRKGWVTVTGKPVENRALWAELDALTDGRVTWEWTPGHAGVPGNERCDEISRWFAASVRRLGRRAGGQRSAERPARQSVPPGTTYLSLVDGVLERHRTWPECQRRVQGVRGARYRKVRGPSEEAEVLRSWGLTPADLSGVGGSDG